MKKLVCLLTLGVIFSISASAQESIGLFYDNYLPANSMLRNPASPVFSPFQWQVNVISAGAFAENNYLYTPNYNNFKMFSDINNHRTPVINFADVNSIHAHAYTFVQGPSAFIQLKGFTIGAFIDEKYAASFISQQAPQSLNVFQNFSFNQNYVVPTFNAAYLHWTEIGVNLGTVIYQSETGTLAAGINIKYLGSTDGFYMNNNKAFTVDRDSFFIRQDQLNNDFGYTSTAGDNRPVGPFNFNFNGHGIGTDIGLLYTTNRRRKDELFNWKLGAALTDIGSIRFRSFSSTYSLNRNTFFQEETNLLRQTTSLQSLAQNGSPVVYDVASGAYTGASYKEVLPGAITLTAEKSLTNGFYLDALLVQRIFLGTNEVERPNTVALTPSYEKKNFAFAVPVVLYDYSKAYFGTSVRVGPVIIGTDNVMSWFVPKNYWGSDIYLGLHINPFSSSKNASSYYHSKTPCPNFKNS